MITPGSIAISEKRFDDAVSLYYTLVCANPDNSHHLANYATAQYLCAQATTPGSIPPGVVNDVISLYRQALQIHNTNLVAWLNLAYVYEESGETEKALQCYAKILSAQDPSKPYLITFALVKIAGLERELKTKNNNNDDQKVKT